MRLDRQQTIDAYINRLWTPRMFKYAEIEFDKDVSVYELLPDRDFNIFTQSFSEELKHTRIADERRLMLLSEKYLSRKYFLPVSVLRYIRYCLPQEEYDRVKRSHLSRKGANKCLDKETLTRLYSNAIYHNLSINEIAPIFSVKPAFLQKQFEDIKYDESVVTYDDGHSSYQELCLPKSFVDKTRYAHLARNEYKTLGLRQYSAKKKAENLSHYEMLKNKPEFLSDIEKIKSLALMPIDFYKKWEMTTSEIALSKKEFKYGRFTRAKRRAFIQHDERNHRQLKGSCCEWVLDFCHNEGDLHKLRNLPNYPDFAISFFEEYAKRVGVEDYSDLTIEKLIKRKIVTIDLARKLEAKGLLIIDKSKIRESFHERQIRALLDIHHIQYEVGNHSVLENLELDFYLPEKKLAIEVNSIDTHHSNDYAVSYFTPKKRGYHFMKYKKTKEKDIELLQLHSTELSHLNFNDWLLTKLNVNVQTIYARKTTWKKAKVSDVKQFYNKYHLNGFARATFHLQRVDETGELVGAASISKKNSTFDLIRVCWKSHTRVVGGLSKLCSYIFKTYPECRVITSFSDNSIGSGKGYASAGFTLLSETGPRMRYVSTSDPSDTYSWQIATPWSMKSGLLKDAGLQNESEIEEYIETKLPHRFDDGCGYFREFTAGSKKWSLMRKGD